MLLGVAPQSPASQGRQPPKSSRIPLQPKEIPSTAPTTSFAKPNNPAQWLDPDNKENVPPISTRPVKEESFRIDASLADELSAIREKLERVRIDKDKTDNLLRERTLKLDLQMKEILNRGQLQKQLEIELDRLYRLQEIKIACVRISPIRSLRDKEQEKKMKQDQLRANIKNPR